VGRGRRTSKKRLAELLAVSLGIQYRLLVLLLAEARRLGPASAAGYRAIALGRLAREIAAAAGSDPRHLARRLAAAYGQRGDCLWERLAGLFAAWEQAVPWGLSPAWSEQAKGGARRGTAPHALPVPDRFLAAAIDALARHCDPASGRLAFRDYRAADVRLLGAIHESLSQCRLVRGKEKAGANGDRPLVLVRDQAVRKAAGSYYTPEPIVRQIVQETIGPLLDRKLAAASGAGSEGDLLEELLDFRVLDPAMGCGYFLLAAADFLSQRLHRFLVRHGRGVARPVLKRRIVARCLYGVDLDPWAVALAKASLWLDSAAPGQRRPADLDRRLRCGNALVGATLDKLADGAGFDAVIGNPPYGGVRTGRIDRALAAYVATRYTAARRNWDLAALFLEKSLAVSKTAGACGFILPARISTNRDFAALRELVFAAGGPAMVLDCGGAFDDPAVLTSIITVVRPPLGPLVRLGRREQRGGGQTWALPRAALYSLPDRPLFSTLRPEEVPLFEKLRQAPYRLGQLAAILRGMECGTSDPHIGGRGRPGWLPVISGRSVHEFRIEPQGLFMRPGLPPAAKYKRPELFQTVPKLLVRFVAPHPVAAVDLHGYLNCNTVYNVLLHAPSLEAYAALACLLNSRPLRWWFTRAFNSEERLFPHIQKYQLQQIPLPALDTTNRHVAELARLGQVAAAGGTIDREAIHTASLGALSLEGLWGR
jgi:hypothetical protein